MKPKTLSAALFCAAFSLSTAGAAGVFYSFDSLADGTGTFTTQPTTEVGIIGNSTFVVNGTLLSTNAAGGWTSSAANNLSGQTWTGSGGTGTPGHSATINPESTGNFYSLTLSTVGLTDISLGFDYRFAGAPASPAFTSFTYTVNGGTATAVPGATLTLAASSPGSTFNQWNANLAGLTAIENQSTVTFTWNLPNFTSGQSFRMDNLQLLAVPEPASAGLLAITGGLLALRRRRAGSCAEHLGLR